MSPDDHGRGGSGGSSGSGFDPRRESANQESKARVTIYRGEAEQVHQDPPDPPGDSRRDDDMEHSVEQIYRIRRCRRARSLYHSLGQDVRQSSEITSPPEATRCNTTFIFGISELQIRASPLHCVYRPMPS